MLITSGLPKVINKIFHFFYFDKNERSKQDKKALFGIISYKNPFPMPWLLLILAGLFEAGFTFCLGKARGLSGSPAAWWYAGFVISLIASMLLLMRALRYLPIGTAYTVWTGIGAAGTVLIGILVFREPATFWRLFFISTLIASIIGLKIFSY